MQFLAYYVPRFGDEILMMSLAVGILAGKTEFDTATPQGSYPSLPASANDPEERTLYPVTIHVTFPVDTQIEEVMDASGQPAYLLTLPEGTSPAIIDGNVRVQAGARVDPNAAILVAVNFVADLSPTPRALADVLKAAGITPPNV